MSFNYHKEHFGEIFGLAGAQASPPHGDASLSAVDRLALAAVREPRARAELWSPDVRAALELGVL